MQLLFDAIETLFTRPPLWIGATLLIATLAILVVVIGSRSE